MSKLIAELLHADQRTFAKMVQRLEHMCLRPGVDTKLTAEIITQTREKARRLALDPADTTKEELYHGLLSKAKSDDLSLRVKLGISEKTTIVDASKIIAENTQKLVNKDIVICLQPASVKKILKAVPPKKTMRILHFRSIDSVLKREDPLVVYALANRLEDKSWHSQIQARLKRLQPRDAIETNVSILYLPNKWLDKLDKIEFDSIIQPVPEIGCILILPALPVMVSGSVLLTTCLVLQASQKLAVQSLPYRTVALSNGYEKLLPEISSGVVQELRPVHGLNPSWDAVFQLLAERGHDNNSEFEFVLSDLEWQSTETKLASLSSELDFWVNSHYLGLVTDTKPVSFHIVDVVASLVLQKKYGLQITTHLQASLWNELQLRYLRQENIERSIVNQLTLSQEIVL